MFLALLSDRPRHWSLSGVRSMELMVAAVTLVFNHAKVGPLIPQTPYPHDSFQRRMPNPSSQCIWLSCLLLNTAIPRICEVSLPHHLNQCALRLRMVCQISAPPKSSTACRFVDEAPTVSISKCLRVSVKSNNHVYGYGGRVFG